MPPIPDVASVVTFRREQLGISKRELGRRSNVSPAYISSLEKGRIQPSFAIFSRIACALRLSSQEVYLLVRSVAAHGTTDD